MSRFRRKLIRPLLTGMLVAGLCWWANAGPKPNILLIVADDMGFSDAGCYGGEMATPNLDRLGRDGLRFSQFYNTGRCWPTRGALLTGYYAQHIRRDTVPGIASGGQGTRPGWAPLLPERLRQLGYRSYHSGKWHIDGARLAGGFDRSYSLEDHDHFFAPRRHLEDDRPLTPVDPAADAYATTLIADHAIRCLRDHARAHPEQPFFSYLCFTAPHFPLQAPAADIARCRGRYDAGWDTVRQRRWQRLSELGVTNHPLPPLEPEVGPPYHFPEALAILGPGELNRPLPWNELTAGQQQFQVDKMTIHAAMIERMDREIGRVLQQLEADRALANTLILLLSDNGASAEIMIRGDGHDPAAPPGSAATYLCLGPGWSSAANTPFRRHKTWVHEGGIATPLIAHWPDGIAARGEWRHLPAHVIDLAPTIVEIAGGEWANEWHGTPAPPLPGRSLVAAFQRDPDVAVRALWWLHEGNRAIRVGNWKLVADRDKPWELYDLRDDRGEQRDLAGRHPDRVRALETQWSTQWASIQDWARRPD